MKANYSDAFIEQAVINGARGVRGGSMPFRVERDDLISPWPERTDERAGA